MSRDPELLRRYAEEGSESAFAELVRLHVNLVYFAALRQVGGDTHRAQDVTQSVFTDLARKAASLAGRPTLTGWLHTSTRYAAAKVRRADATRRQYEQEAEIMHELLPDSGSSAEWEQLRSMVDDAIHELNDRDREAVLLRFFEGRSFGDIGGALNISEDGARMRVERALDKLRAALSRRGVSSTAAALAGAFANQVGATAPAGLTTAVTSAALADAAAGSGAVAALLNHMTATKVTITLGVVAFLAITTAVYQTSQARTAADSLANAGKDQAALQARLKALETRVQAAEGRRTELEQTLEQQRTASAPALKPPALAPPDRVAAMQPAINAAFRADPELRKFRLQRIEVDVRQDYAPLFKELRFTPAQIQQFADLLAQWVINQPDQGIGRDGPNFGLDGAALDEISDEAFVSMMRTQFGSAAAERYVQLEKTLAARFIVNQISSAPYYTDAPLTVQQADRLVQIITDAKTGELTRRDAGNWRLKVDWNQVLAQAQPVLSAAQLQGIRAMAAQVRRLAQKRGEPVR